MFRCEFMCCYVIIAIFSPPSLHVCMFYVLILNRHQPLLRNVTQSYFQPTADKTHLLIICLGMHKVTTFYSVYVYFIQHLRKIQVLLSGFCYGVALVSRID